MRPEDFSPRAAGALMEIQTYRGERAFAFVPNPLPPDEQFSEELQTQATRALLAIGRLDGLAEALPNRRFLLRPFIQREALASSRIEGTHADLAQLAVFEASQDSEDFTPDIQEVVNYTRALEYGWEQLAHRDITLGLIREMHALLMDGVRGADKGPGEFRTIQNFIGRPGDTAATARFVPPPPGLVEPMMSDVERYIAHARHSLFDLAMIHYQFEVIHPFLDGNGRLGRLLITLAMGRWKLLESPLLYVSSYFERYRDEYIDHLDRVSQEGAWSEWISFFLTAVETQALDGVERGRRLITLREELRANYQGGRGSAVALTIIDGLFDQASMSIAQTAERAGISKQGARRAILRLVDDGLLVEATDRRRNQAFLAPRIIEAIEQ